MPVASFGEWVGAHEVYRGLAGPPERSDDSQYRQALLITAKALPGDCIMPVPAGRLLELLVGSEGAAAPVAEPTERMLTAEEVAELLGTSKRWVYNNANKLGGKRLSRGASGSPSPAIRRRMWRSVSGDPCEPPGTWQHIAAMIIDRLTETVSAGVRGAPCSVRAWPGRPVVLLYPQPSCGSSPGSGPQRRPSPMPWLGRWTNGAPQCRRSPAASGRPNRGGRKVTEGAMLPMRGASSASSGSAGASGGLRYRVNGQEHRESSHSTSQREAEKLLAKRQAELSVGILTAPATKRVTLLGPGRHGPQRLQGPRAALRWAGWKSVSRTSRHTSAPAGRSPSRPIV